jgi:hypothetical protein
VNEDEMGRECSTNEDKRDACRILVGKKDEKGQLGRQGIGGLTILKWTLEG